MKDKPEDYYNSSCLGLVIILLCVCVCVADINECNSNNGGCEQICTNMDGSFSCSCLSGFIQNSSYNCTGQKYVHLICSACAYYNDTADINECLSNNGGCEHLCVNDPGNFSCSCLEGYELIDMFNCSSKFPT